MGIFSGRHFRELFIVYAIICGINLLFFKDDFMFVSWKLHPFLFTTILFAVRYGIWEGIASGILGASIITYAIFETHSEIEMELLYGFDSLSLPLVVVVMGIIIGETIESKMKKNEYYKTALKKEVDAHLDKNKESKALKVSLLEVERKLASHSIGIHDFSNNLIKLFELKKMPMYEQIHVLLKKFLNVDKAVILISNPDAYHLKGIDQDGNELDEDQVLEIQQHTLFQISQLDREVKAMSEDINLIDETKLNTIQPYYCGPVIINKNKLDAMVVVLNLDFIHFNITNFRLFDMIIKAASYARAIQSQVDHLHHITPYHEKYLVERDHYFLKHLVMLLEYLEEVDVILVGFKFLDHVNKGQQEGFNMLLSQLCIRSAARAGYLDSVNCFVFYKEGNSGDELINEVKQRYMNYGFSIGMAQLKLGSITITQKEANREYEHLISHFQKCFDKIPVTLDMS